jgi:hypothetical protein
MRKTLVSLIVLVASLAMAQTDQRPEILVLGTYHMANPGHDIYNMQADDVLAPRRQQEIAQVIEVLKKFHPTKIAIESDVFSKKAPQQYADYLAGKYTLSRNEIDQLGYRLAKELGHKTVYAVDVDGDFPYQRLVNFAKAKGSSDKLEAISSQWGTEVKQQGDYLQSHTILEMLEFINTDARAAHDMGLYYATVPFSEPGDYAAADLIASWYQRNVRIYSNIIRLVDSPNERILVIYGYGHLPWLRREAMSDPSVRLRKLSDFVEKK